MNWLNENLIVLGENITCTDATKQVHCKFHFKLMTYLQAFIEQSEERWSIVAGGNIAWLKNGIKLFRDAYFTHECRTSA